MSRIGRKPITIPAGVEIKQEGHLVTVKGPKGTLARELRPEITVSIEDNIINVTRPSDKPVHRSYHGLTRTLIANMIEGVTNGFSKNLELVGVGYRAALKGTKLVLTVGKSHPVEMDPWEGIEIEFPPPLKLPLKVLIRKKWESSLLMSVNNVLLSHIKVKESDMKKKLFAVRKEKLVPRNKVRAKSLTMKG